MASILLVDDHPSLRSVFKRALEYLGFEVHEAADGYAALTCLEHLRPSLVISDVAMPHIDGAQLVRVMAKHPRLAQIPVLLMSGEGTTAPAGYPVLEKPVPLAELATTVRRLIAQEAERCI